MGGSVGLDGDAFADAMHTMLESARTVGWCGIGGCPGGKRKAGGRPWERVGLPRRDENSCVREESRVETCVCVDRGSGGERKRDDGDGSRAGFGALGGCSGGAWTWTWQIRSHALAVVSKKPKFQMVVVESDQTGHQGVSRIGFFFC